MRDPGWLEDGNVPESRVDWTLLLSSRVQRSPSNTALGILPRAFASAADAIQGIGSARWLTC